MPDKPLNLRNENAQNKLTPKTLLRTDLVTINLQIVTNTNSGFDVLICRAKNQKRRYTENFEACDTQPVKYLAFPYLLFQKCLCFAFFF